LALLNPLRILASTVGQNCKYSQFDWISA